MKFRIKETRTSFVLQTKTVFGYRKVAGTRTYSTKAEAERALDRLKSSI